MKQFLIVIGLCYGHLLFAQQVVYKNYTPNDGLASNETYTLLSDKQGYIWIGTDRGLSRFDGKNFQTFSTQDGLPNNFVNMMWLSPKGILWVLCGTDQQSIYKFNGRSFEPYLYNDSIKKALANIAAAYIVSMGFNNEVPTYFGTKNGGGFIIESNGILRFLNNPNKQKMIEIGLDLDKKVVWTNVSNLKGLAPKVFYLNDSITITDNPRPDKLRLCIRKNKEVIISFGKYIFTIHNNKSIEINKVEADVLNLYEDTHQDLWVCYITKGLYKYPKANFKTTPEKYYTDLRITDITQDFENNYWISTHEKGIFYIPDFGIQEIEPPQLTSNEIIRTITSTPHYPLVIGTNEINLFPFKNNRWQNSLLDLKKFKDPNSNIQFNSLKIGLYIKAINYDSTNHCLIVNWGGGTFLVDLFSNKLTYYNDASNHSILYQDTLLIATSSRKQIIKYVIHQPAKKTAYINTHSIPYYLYQDKNKTIWVGTENGLGMYNSDTEIMQHTDKIKTRITGMGQLSNNTLVASSLGSGIYFINKDTCLQSTIEGTIQHNMINKFVIVNDTIWCATQAGIVYMDARDIYHVKKFTISSKTGFMYNDIKSITYNNGNLYVLSQNKLFSINTHTYQQNFTPPKIVLHHIVINDTLRKRIDTTIQFKSSYKRLGFEFDGIAFKTGNNIQYQYCLLHKFFDTLWIETNQPYANFNNTEAGNYTFLVRSINENGIKSAIAYYSFTLPNPFYKQAWFVFLCLCVLSFMVYTYNHNRIKKIKQQNKMRELMLHYEQQALASQINPHFIFNVINNIQSYILKEDKRKAYHYLSKFSKLMRLSLDNSREKWVTLQKEKELLDIYLTLEQMRFETFDYEINIDKKINTETTLVPSMILQPYIENCLKHGIFHLKEKRGFIKVSLEIDQKNNILCEIEDNGIGRERAAALKPIHKEHKSAGQQITNERLALLLNENDQAQYFEIIDLPNHTGTKILLYLPYKRITFTK